MNSLTNSLKGFSNFIEQRLREADDYEKLEIEVLKSKFDASPLIRKIIEKPIAEALKNFITADDKVLEKYTELKVKDHLRNAVIEARKVGNIALIYKDGKPLDSNPSNNFLGFLTIIIDDNTFTYEDGVKSFKVEVIEDGETVEYEVHENRYIVLGGEKLLHNEDSSIIEDVYEFVSYLEDSFRVPVKLMHRLQSDIIKMNGLAESLSSCGNESECQKMYQKLFERIQVSYSLMDSFHLMPIDKEEDLEQITKNISQFTELQNSLMLMVSAVSEIPMTILFGKSPSGFSSGTHEMENWHNFVGREIQSKYFTPILEFINPLLGIKLDIEYASLEHISREEKLDFDKKECDTQKTRADIISTLNTNLETSLTDEEIIKFINDGVLEHSKGSKV